MKKFSSSLIRSTFFVIDSDLLLKSAPPVEQTHYFQTGPILQYQKYVNRKKLDKNRGKSPKYDNKNNQSYINNKKNHYYQKEAKQLNEEQLDEEIKATRKRLMELYARKEQLMIIKQKKLADRNKKERKYDIPENDQSYYYEQYYWPQYWDYSERQDQQNFYYDEENQYSKWPQQPKYSSHQMKKKRQEERVLSQQEPKEKSKKHKNLYWYNYYT